MNPLRTSYATPQVIGITADARVMSPTDIENLSSKGVLIGLSCRCGRIGHPHCVRVQLFQPLPFLLVLCIFDGGGIWTTTGSTRTG
eukprot:2629098-Prorocentrum_lima.AAC.1